MRITLSLGASAIASGLMGLWHSNYGIYRAYLIKVVYNLDSLMPSICVDIHMGLHDGQWVDKIL